MISPPLQPARESYGFTGIRQAQLTTILRLQHNRLFRFLGFIEAKTLRYIKSIQTGDALIGINSLI
jgi:hypothetical protein